MKSLCILPWISLDTLPDGSLSPCCYFDPQFRKSLDEDHGLDHYLKSSELQQLKEDLIQGKCPAACHQCFSLESKGEISPRTKSNDKFSKEFDTLRTSPGSLKIRSLNLRLNNNCDLTCRTCNPFCSTSWNKDSKALNKNHNPLVLNLFKDHPKLEREIYKLCESVNYLYISGGEPFMAQELVPILEAYLNKSDEKESQIEIQTNLASKRIFQEPFYSQLKKISNLTLSISIDGLEEKGELIRSGLIWDEFLSNIDRAVQEFPNAKILFTPTISILNAYHIIDVFEFIRTNFQSEKIWLDVNMVNTPLALNPQILTRESKEKLIEFYLQYESSLKKEEDVKFRRALNEIGQFIMAKDLDDQLLTFYSYSKSLDKLRQENTLDVFPELRHPAFSNL